MAAFAPPQEERALPVECAPLLPRAAVDRMRDGRRRKDEVMVREILLFSRFSVQILAFLE